MKKVKLFSLLFVLVFLLSQAAGEVVAQSSPDDPPFPPKVQEKIDNLHKVLEKEIKKELATGETKIAADGSRVFTGESAERLREFSEKIAKQIDALVARPRAERQTAIENIKSITGERATYIETTTSPYNSEIPVEMYKSDTRTYLIDARDSSVVQIDIPAETAARLDYTPHYSVSELKEMAATFIEQAAGEVNLSALSPEHGNKNEEVYFFRWEDQSKRLESGLFPFIQVGISAGGDVGTYVNTLGLSGPEPEAGSFTEFYANDGNYYNSGGWAYTKTGGYCYNAGWCSPKYFRYREEQASWGYWGIWDNPNNSTWDHVYAYIPSTKATTHYAVYEVHFYYGVSYEAVPQYWYYDAFVQLTTDGTLYRVTHTYLDNVPGGAVHSSRDVAFDEIKVVYYY